MMSLLAFVVTILVIVAIHEYGHFLAMRLFRVRVLKFSIGFGPALWRHRSDKSGTDYVIAAFPLGGYVKPYDSRAEADAADGLDGDFAAIPAWQKLITYAAGPFANFVLALVLYWIIAIHGQYGITPVVDSVTPESAAATAGVKADDVITAADGTAVRGWQQLSNLMMAAIGSDRPVELEVTRDGKPVTVALSLASWINQPDIAPLEAVGIRPQPPAAILGDIVSGGAADRAGLRAGDRVVRVDGKEVDSWQQWVEVVQAHPDSEIAVDVERKGMLLSLSLVPATSMVDGNAIGVAGVRLGGLTHIQYDPLQAVVPAWMELKQQTVMLVGATWRLFSGKLGLEALGGPITIAKAAGDTASVGVVTFFAFLAFFSISLGILNLLPVPMLDGGWMVFCLAEMLIRRPLPEKFLVAAQSLGLTLVVMLMVVAFYNDLIRQFG